MILPNGTCAAVILALREPWLVDEVFEGSVARVTERSSRRDLLPEKTEEYRNLYS
jgi:hypothetical protein